MNVYKSTFYFTVYILFTLKIFAVGLIYISYQFCVDNNLCLYVHQFRRVLLF